MFGTFSLIVVFLFNVGVSTVSVLTLGDHALYSCTLGTGVGVFCLVCGFWFSFCFWNFLAAVLNIASIFFSCSIPLSSVAVVKFTLSSAVSF